MQRRDFIKLSVLTIFIKDFFSMQSFAKISQSNDYLDLIDKKRRQPKVIGLFEKGGVLFDKQQMFFHAPSCSLWGVTEDIEIGNEGLNVNPTDEVPNKWALRHELDINRTHKFYLTDYITSNENNLTLALQEISRKAQIITDDFEVIFNIDYGEVFEQEQGYMEGQPYYRTLGDCIKLDNCSNFTLRFSGSKLVTKKGLSFGAFEPKTGERFDSSTKPSFTDNKFAAKIGWVVHLTHCKNYLIIEPNFVGNSGALNIGGRWGDKGIQLDHGGIKEILCRNGFIIKAECNYFGLDGMYIGGHEENIENNLVHIAPICKYNGRQGLSITGGNNIIFINPIWSYTGTLNVSSMPRAGIDLEPNGKYKSKNIYIFHPEIIGNAGASVLSISNEVAYIYGGTLFSENTNIYSPNLNSELVLDKVNIIGPLRISRGKILYYNCNIFFKEGKNNNKSEKKLISNVGKEVVFYKNTITAGVSNLEIHSGEFIKNKFNIDSAKENITEAYFNSGTNSLNKVNNL